MHGQSDTRDASSGGRAASFADGNFVADAESKRDDFFLFSFENLAVGVENEVVFEFAADLVVAPGGGDGELVGGTGIDVDVKIHGDRGRVERRSQVGRGGRQNQVKRSLASGTFFLRHISWQFSWQSLFGLLGQTWGPDFSACSRVRITASSVASRTMGGRHSDWSVERASLWDADGGNKSPR